MPIDPVTGSLIVAGASALSQGANAFAQGSMNKKTRQWSEKMWNSQNAVNDANWHRNNAYNSPSNQMQLLKDAKLNPYLIYGKGGPDMTASAPPSAPSPEGWKPEAPSFDGSQIAAAGMSAYYDAQLKPAQVDNLKGATLNAAASTAADVSLKNTQAANITQDTSQKNSLFKYAEEAAKKSNDLLDADIALRQSQGHMSVDMRNKIRQEIANIEQDYRHEKEKHPINVEMLKNNVKFQQFKAMLNDNGFTENDNVLWRLFGKWGAKAIKAAGKVTNRTPNFKKDLHPNNGYSKGQ